MPIIVQQDATIHSLITSVNRSTCFGWYLHPSSGAHVTVSTASGIIETVTASCREGVGSTFRTNVIKFLPQYMISHPKIL